MNVLKISTCHPDAVIPSRATPGSAGLDLYAVEDAVVQPGGSTLVKTGLILEIPKGHAGFIWPRSGLALKSCLDTGAGLIDSDYRGEVGVVLFNHGINNATVQKGHRIAQLVVQEYPDLFHMVVSEVSGTERDGGFGSTGQ